MSREIAIGRWVLNETLSSLPARTWEIDGTIFNSIVDLEDGCMFERFGTSEIDGYSGTALLISLIGIPEKYLYYVSKDHTAGLDEAYIYTHDGVMPELVAKDSERGLGLRSFEIIGGIDSNSEDLIAWLNENATPAPERAEEVVEVEETPAEAPAMATKPMETIEVSEIATAPVEKLDVASPVANANDGIALAADGDTGHVTFIIDGCTPTTDLSVITEITVGSSMTFTFKANKGCYFDYIPIVNGSDYWEKTDSDDKLTRSFSITFTQAETEVWMYAVRDNPYINRVEFGDDVILALQYDNINKNAIRRDYWCHGSDGGIVYGSIATYSGSITVS